MQQYYVYILASAPYGTLYIGVTSDILKRIYEHKNDIKSGFASKYNVHQLVYYEITPNISATLQREKTLKCYKRDWKIDLITKHNPEWQDLYLELVS